MKDRTRLAILGALVGLLVALGATGLFIARSARLEEAAYLAHNDALARAMAAAIQAREDGYQHICPRTPAGFASARPWCAATARRRSSTCGRSSGRSPSWTGRSWPIRPA